MTKYLAEINSPLLEPEKPRSLLKAILSWPFHEAKEMFTFFASGLSPRQLWHEIGDAFEDARNAAQSVSEGVKSLTKRIFTNRN